MSADTEFCDADGERGGRRESDADVRRRDHGRQLSAKQRGDADLDGERSLRCCPQNSVVTRTWTASDHCGHSTTASQVINVVDTTAPTISTLPGPATIECPLTPSFATPTASDACDASPTLTFADATTAGSCPQNSVVTRTWTASDHCGHSTTASQVINVV